MRDFLPAEKARREHALAVIRERLPRARLRRDRDARHGGLTRGCTPASAATTRSSPSTCSSAASTPTDLARPRHPATRSRSPTSACATTSRCRSPGSTRRHRGRAAAGVPRDPDRARVARRAPAEGPLPPVRAVRHRHHRRGRAARRARAAHRDRSTHARRARPRRLRRSASTTGASSTGCSGAWGSPDELRERALITIDKLDKIGTGGSRRRARASSASSTADVDVAAELEALDDRGRLAPRTAASSAPPVVARPAMRRRPARHSASAARRGDRVRPARSCAAWATTRARSSRSPTPTSATRSAAAAATTA